MRCYRSNLTNILLTFLYFRYIYNRVILENATVRAAAVSALARFGALCDDLLPNILVLLARCQLDTDDEVRDRATYFRAILEQQNPAMNSQYILNGLLVSLSSLEKALHNYTLSPCAEPFDIKTVPVAPVEPVERRKSTSADLPGAKKSGDKAPTATRHDMFVEKFAAIPEIVQLGPLFKSSQPAELTESETEYVVQCIKHVFPQHLLLQFECTNTLNDQLLEQVSIQLEAAEGYSVERILPCSRLEYNVPGTVYVVLATPPDMTDWVGTMSPTLKFIVKDCDPNTGEPDSDEGYEDEYVLEDLEVSMSDFVQRAMKGNFLAAWEEMGAENELEDTYALSSMKTLEEAVKNIIQYLGLQPCERSDKIPEGKSSHALLLAGKSKFTIYYVSHHFGSGFSVKPQCLF